MKTAKPPRKPQPKTRKVPKLKDAPAPAGDDEWLRVCDELLRQRHPLCKRIAQIINDALDRPAKKGT
jgi:hypothetical protein